MKKLLLSILLGSLLVPVLASGQNITIPNPLRVENFTDLICLIIGFLIELSIPIGAIMITVAGFFFVTAAEDPGKIDTGKKIVLWTLIGLLIVFSSYAIISAFADALGASSGGVCNRQQQDFLNILDRVSNWLWAILMVVAAIFIIISGFHFVSAQGDPQKIQLAKQFLLYALIGVLVGSLAKALVILIITIVTGTQSDTSPIDTNLITLVKQKIFGI